MAQGIAIMDAARKCGAPVIVQASHGARAHAGDTMLRWIVEALAEPYSEIPICMHHDHGNDVSTCLSAIRNGFTSVTMDGSLKADAKTPADYDYNARVTRTVAHLAHMVGASVEGDLGCLGSLEIGMGEAEDGHGFEGALLRHQLLTDPGEAARFVAETGVDALAVAIGSSHEAYEFSGKPDGAVLAMDVIEKIHARLPNTHIMMHGSSTVPQKSQDAFNDHGGEMRPISCVPVDEIVRGIRHGVRKVNIDTDLRLAAAAAIRRADAMDRSEFDPRKVMKPAMDQVCRDRFEAFGTAGHAHAIQPISMAEMACRYASGALSASLFAAAC
jgi:fructose-bisphosphate aldolase class II